MKVIIEMSNEELKEYMHDYSDSYVRDGEKVGLLVFHEGEYRHGDDCKCGGKEIVDGQLCKEDSYKPKRRNTAFKVLQILP